MATIWTAAAQGTLTKRSLLDFLDKDPSLLDREDGSGLTPLGYALCEGKPKVVKLLLDNQANPDKMMGETMPYPDGRTPVYLAARARKSGPRMMQLLLEKNPKTFDQPVTSRIDETPLMAAIRVGDPKVIKMLIKQGASLDKLRRDGKSAQDLANALWDSLPEKTEIQAALEPSLERGSGFDGLQLSPVSQIPTPFRAQGQDAETEQLEGYFQGTGAQLPVHYEQGKDTTHTDDDNASSENEDEKQEMDEIEIESVLSDLPSLTAGSTISSALTLGLIEDIKADVLTILTKDKDFYALFQETPKRITHEKFQRNFLRLFRSFLSDIRNKSHVREQDLLRQVIRVLRYQSRTIQVPDKGSHLTSFFQDDRYTRRRHYNKLKTRPLANQHEPFDEGDLSEGESEDPETVRSYPIPLGELEVIILKSESFLTFREGYRAFLFPRPDPQPSEAAIPTDSSDPVDCGDDLYADFPEPDADSICQLVASLKGNTAHAGDGTAPPQASHPPGGVSAPTAASGSSPSHPSSNTQAINTGQPPSQNQSPITSGGAATHTNGPAGQVKKRFIELCVNTGEFQRSLAEIDVSTASSDAQLFDRIRERYREVRSFRTKYFLLKPVDVHFVQFSVEDRHRVGILDKPMAIPSIAEMAAEGYTYYPCPLRPPPIPANIFLHHLSKPGRHPKLVWGSRIPQKLDRSILQIQTPNDLVTGWGVHIIEGLNKTAVLLCSLVGLLISMIVAVVWAVVKDDVQGAFGIGAWLTSVEAIVVMLVVTQWLET
ncbi:hypothetical protein B0I37DRAFT_409119 [Chaetomium sp. MPI-CAGE-AT-0009]|nr:hypothetical protein B0I37DRAFT_409119 [Chaetomium sp. MPI-CAGE-AT-0009]